jgi:hypothetical protein
MDPGHRPASNRVTPFGDVVGIEQRGAWMGNRGRLHDVEPDGTVRLRRFHAGNAWIICALDFRERRVEQWGPNHYTVLFFLDEAVALAAGHRPCAECRRKAYDAYLAATGLRSVSAPELNRRLHAERLYPWTHQRRLHERSWSELPNGAFVVVDDVAHLVNDADLVPWTETGYGPAVPRPRAGIADVLTPPTSLAALVGGYPVQIGRDRQQAKESRDQWL